MLLAPRNSDSKHLTFRLTNSLRAVVKSFELSRNVKAYHQQIEWAAPTSQYFDSPSIK